MPRPDAPRYRCSLADGRADLPADSRVLHFFRHGEAVHQVRNAEAESRGEGCRCFDAIPGGGRESYVCPYWSEDLVDAPLTALGREQAIGRGAALSVERVFTSPTTRTLETSVLAFPSQVSIVALSDLRPRVGRHMHSRCSPRSSLEARFPRVDFGGIPHGEDRAWSAETEPRAALEERAARFLDTVFSVPERRVAVVTHFTVLLALLLPGDDTFTLGPGRRPPGSPALLDASGCPDPAALRVPVRVGEARSLLVVRDRPIP